MKAPSIFQFLFCVVLFACIIAVSYTLEFKFDKLSKREISDHQDLGQLRADNVSLVEDILSLKTDYAEVTKFRDALSSYTAARKDVGAFRELDDACGRLFMGIVTKESELDKRLEKIEKRCRK